MAFKNNREFIKSDLDLILSDIEEFKATFMSTTIEEGEGDREREVPGDRENSFFNRKLDAEITNSKFNNIFKRINDLLDRKISMIEELKNRNEENGILKADEAIQLVSTVNILQEELLDFTVNVQFINGRSVNNRIARFKAYLNSVSGKITNFFMPLLNKIKKRLWNIIAHLVTPKEWSVGGELGNDLWGLGKVKMEIKFGK